MMARQRTFARRIISVIALAMAALACPAAARAATVTISPIADAFVRAQEPSANFGSVDFLDSQGGLSTYACGSDLVQHPGAAYSYLKFDLSAIPPGTVIEGVDLELTSRTGFAFDGDPDQHIRFVGDDSWTETGLTYNSSPTGVADSAQYSISWSQVS